MNEILAPEILTQRLARRAVEIAQVIGPRKTGKGLSSLIPVYQPGLIGIEVPQDTAYMMDLEKGITVHAMVNLAGRVIPVRNPNGTISFRRASQDSIGVKPLLVRMADGKIKNNKSAWVYPQKPGLSFLQTSLKISINEWLRTAKSKDIIEMLLKTNVKDDVSMIIYGKGVV